MKILALIVLLLAPCISYAQSGIDFMAIQRGRQQAADDNYRDMQRQQELERMRQAQLYGQQPQYQPYDDTQWESASNLGQAQTGDPSIIRCFYQTSGGFRFSINRRSFYCPTSVEVDPISSRVKVQ